MITKIISGRQTVFSAFLTDDNIDNLVSHALSLSRKKGEEKLSEKELLQILADKYGTAIEKLKSKDRSRPLPEIRGFIFFHFLTEHNYSTVKAGQLLNRDHCTVIHWRDRINSEPELRERYARGF